MKAEKPDPDALTDISGASSPLVEDVSPSPAELLVAQQAAMRQREAEAREREAVKYGVRLAQTFLPKSNGEHSSYRWTLAENGDSIELHDIPFALADNLSMVLDDHGIKYTRYQQVSTWTEG